MHPRKVTRDRAVYLVYHKTPYQMALKKINLYTHLLQILNEEG